MDEKLNLVTEQINLSTQKIDRCSTKEMLQMLNHEDQIVPYLVEKEIDSITKVVDAVAGKMKLGGRLFYIGAGTSGRLGFLDASECPPTFGVSEDMIQAIIAGGDVALRHAIEGAEDNECEGKNVIASYKITEEDVVVGISASGRTPFVLAAIKEANEQNILTVGISNNRNSELEKAVALNICIEVGPEAIRGSTRLKAGTAQKLVLNMISTGVMIKLGRVYKNLMVCMKPTNYKLVERSKVIVQCATGISYQTAEQYLTEAQGNIKAAIVMAEKKCDLCTALKLLEEYDEHVALAVGK